MENIYFSARELGFFIGSWLEEGIYTEDNWPEDAVLMTSEELEEYHGKGSPEGKVLGSKDGRPAWVDPPHEMQVNIANVKRQSLLDEANQKISVWKITLLMGDELSDGDIVQLRAWIAFINALNAIDTEKAPDIEWPIEPQPQ